MATYKMVNADQLDADLQTVADKIREKAELSEQLLFPAGFINGIDQCSSLNFSVVGGTSQPSDPKENTIWVNTNEEITGWIFSATEPEAPEDGLVWIVTGQASTVAFNALKKNNLQVYPLSAKQRVGNAWVDVLAKSYQGGEWVDWIVYLYNKGDECIDLTGGWVGKGMKASSTSEAAAAEPIITRNDDHILAKLPAAQKSGVFWTHELVDLTTCSKITVEGEFYAVSSNFALTIWSSNEGTYYTQNNAAESKFPAKEVFNKLSVDVSALTGEYCIGFKLNTNGDTSNQSYIKLVQSYME